MTFLWHLRGSVALPDQVEDDVVLERVSTLLAKQRKPVTELDSCQIRFNDPLWQNIFSGGNWRAMVIYDRGLFSIKRGHVQHNIVYDLRSLHGFIYCLSFSIVIFCFGLLDARVEPNLLFAAVAFGWLYGINILLALIRVPIAIRRAVRAE